MKPRWLIVLAFAAAIAGCASVPDEGGIVGTGNRPDCAALKKRGETPLPPECRVSEPPPYR